MAIDGDQNCLHVRPCGEFQDSWTIAIDKSLLCDAVEHIIQNQGRRYARFNKSLYEMTENQTIHNEVLGHNDRVKTYHLNSITRKIFTWVFKDDPMYVRFS